MGKKKRKIRKEARKTKSVHPMKTWGVETRTKKQQPQVGVPDKLSLLVRRDF